MAIADADLKALFMNPSAYAGVKDSKKTKEVKRGGKTEFTRFFDE